MAEIKYTTEQIQELLNNKYVKSCTNKNISFTKEFKIRVMELWKQWLFYRDIFQKLWFPEYIINSKLPESSYSRWKRNLINWEIEQKKWRKKKEKFDITKMSKDEELEYLRHKVAYLEELKKLVDWGYP